MTTITPAQILEPMGPTSAGGMAWEIHCPTCGAQIMDRNATGGDHNAVTLHPDRDAYDSPTGSRGGYLRVELVCSGGHAWSLILANHKGLEELALIPGPTA